MKEILEGLLKQLLPMLLTPAVILNAKAKFQAALNDLADQSGNKIDDILVDLLLSQAVTAMFEEMVLGMAEKLALSTDTSLDDAALKLIKEALKKEVLS